MAHTNIDYIDYIITAPDALDNSFGVSAPLEVDVNDHSFVIEVVAGSIQFRVGDPVGANSPIHAAGAKIILTNVNRRTIYYKAAAGGNQFTVSF